MSKKVVDIVKTVVIVAMIVGMFLLLAYEQTHYVRVGHVTLDHSFAIDNYYNFTDSTGQIYSFVSTDAIGTDDVVRVKMFNNCTEENIYDDMIIDYEIISDTEK